MPLVSPLERTTRHANLDDTLTDPILFGKRGAPIFRKQSRPFPALPGAHGSCIFGPVRRRDLDKDGILKR